MIADFAGIKHVRAEVKVEKRHEHDAEPFETRTSYKWYDYNSGEEVSDISVLVELERNYQEGLANGTNDSG
jgi:hypothetical protein